MKFPDDRVVELNKFNPVDRVWGPCPVDYDSSALFRHQQQHEWFRSFERSAILVQLFAVLLLRCLRLGLNRLQCFVASCGCD